MKKRFFCQGIGGTAVTFIITILISICFSSLYASVNGIPATINGDIMESVVVKNGVAMYSSASFSAVDMQRLIMSVESDYSDFSANGIDYNADKKDFPDGTVLISLYSPMEENPANKIIFFFTILIFIISYLIIALYIQRMNERDIIIPLKNLGNALTKLSDGELDINIPDSGVNEISAICREAEKLRLRLSDEVYNRKKSDENRKFLISGISHDLRTPVTSIKGYLEGIYDGIADTEEKKRSYLKKSIEKTDLINSMIEDLLLYSKLDMKQLDFKYQMVDAGEYISTFADEAKIVYGGEGIDITYENSLSIPYGINIDMAQLDRVMSNIMSNAVKYVPNPGGVISITLRENISSVIIETKDNGCGISKEDLPKIFDRFYRGDKSRRIKGSSGLGLTISKQIVERMGGVIWASSNTEGTSIYVSLKKHIISKGEPV